MENKKNDRKKREKVLLCCILKMENHYLEEWLIHYKKLGVDKVVIYDNNDISGKYAENIRELSVVREGEKSGLIDIISVPNKYKIQCECYSQCYYNYCDEYDWLMFLDIDEYLQLEKFTDIHDYLEQDIFKKYEIIHVNWKIFDDNDLLGVNEGNYSLENRFTREMAIHCPVKNWLNKEVKSIVKGGILNCSFTKNPHTITSKKLECCDAIGGKEMSMEQKSRKVLHEGAWINHYITKTIQEYIDNKMARGGGCTKSGRYNLNFFFRYNDKTEEKIKIGEKIIPQKERTKIKSLGINGLYS